jgi:hypothetical protein
MRKTVLLFFSIFVFVFGNAQSVFLQSKNGNVISFLLSDINVVTFLDDTMCFKMRDGSQHLWPVNNIGNLKYKIETSIINIDSRENKDAVTIYPNPSYDGNLNVKIASDFSGIIQMKITGEDSKVVYDDKRNFESSLTPILQICLDDILPGKLLSGLYFINIKMGDTYYSKKVILKNNK